MNLTKYVACICEGAAEKAIMEILLDADKLIFKRDDLLEGELLRCRSGKNFEEQHLRKGFTEKITVLHILDGPSYISHLDFSIFSLHGSVWLIFCCRSYSQHLAATSFSATTFAAEDNYTASWAEI